MNNVKNIALSLLVVIGILSYSFPVAAQDEEKVPDYIMDTSRIGETEDGYIRSEQALELGSPTPSALYMEGEQSLRVGGIDRALTVLQRAVEMAPLDIDNRILYAQTLEKKLMMQKDKKDPKLFNFLVKQWYYVYKQAEFYDQTMMGLSHVYELSGKKPGHFESAHKFFARALIAEDGSVKVALGGAGSKITPGAHKKVSKDDLDFELDPDKEIRQHKEANNENLN